MSTDSIKIFTDIKTLKENIKNGPITNFVIEGRKESKTYKGGTKFYDVKVKDPKGASINKYPLIVKISDITISYDMPDPSKKKKDDEADKDKADDKKRLISLMVGRTGYYGELISVVNDEYVKWCNKMNESLGKNPPVVWEMIQTTYSYDHPDVEKRGKEKEHPTLRLKLDFSKYPEKYPKSFLRGQSKTEIYDYSTKYIEDKDGKKIIKYKLAEVDGKPVDETNVHKFITRGSKIIDGRIHLDNANKSKFGWSMPQLAGRLVISPAPPGGFEGEEEEATDADFAELEGTGELPLEKETEELIDTV